MSAETVIDQSSLSVAEAKELILQTLWSKPDFKNPTDRSGTCLYSTQEGGSCRCVIGEVAARSGWRVPGPQEVRGVWGIASSLWPGLSYPVVSLLDEVQELADKHAGSGFTWSTTAKMLEERWKLSSECLNCWRKITRWSEDDPWQSDDDAADEACYVGPFSDEVEGGHIPNIAEES